MSSTFARLRAASPFFVVAGPCVIESLEHSLSIAKKVKSIGARLNIPIIFKASFDKANRQSISSYRGPGLERGLDILRTVKDEVGVMIATDIHEPHQAASVGEVADIIQIPAMLCRQTDLIVAAGNTGRVVNIKKGQFASPNLMMSAAQKAHEGSGYACGGVLLTERGTTFGYDDLVVDFRNLTAMRGDGGGGDGPQQQQQQQQQQQSLVVMDVTHSVQQPRGGGGPSSSSSSSLTSGGQREFVPDLARAAAAVGVDGFFIETHDAPHRALSDAATVYPLKELEPLLARLIRIAHAATPDQ